MFQNMNTRGPFTDSPVLIELERELGKVHQSESHIALKTLEREFATLWHRIGSAWGSPLAMESFAFHNRIISKALKFCKSAANCTSFHWNHLNTPFMFCTISQTGRHE